MNSSSYILNLWNISQIKNSPHSLNLTVKSNKLYWVQSEYKTAWRWNVSNINLLLRKKTKQFFFLSPAITRDTFTWRPSTSVIFYSLLLFLLFSTFFSSLFYLSCNSLVLINLLSRLSVIHPSVTSALEMIGCSHKVHRWKSKERRKKWNQVIRDLREKYPRPTVHASILGSKFTKLHRFMV